MDVRPEIQIQSMIKAMIDVVLPSVDAENKLAIEQSHLIIGTLQLVAKRLPIAYRYDRDELERYVALSKALVSQLDPVPGSTSTGELAKLVVRGNDVLERARAEPSELESTTFDLRASVGSLIAETRAKGTPEAKAIVRNLVLDASKKELERERALVVDIGFEPDPSNLPTPIDKQLPPLKF